MFILHFRVIYLVANESSLIKIFLSHTTMLRHISAPILTLITIIIMVITNTIPICTIFWWWRCEKERGEWETVALDSIAGTPASSPPAWDTFTHTNFTHTTFLQCGNSSTNSITHLRHFYFTGQPIITCVWSKLYNFWPVYFCWVNTSDIGLVGQFEPEENKYSELVIIKVIWFSFGCGRSFSSITINLAFCGASLE